MGYKQLAIAGVVLTVTVAQIGLDKNMYRGMGKPIDLGTNIQVVYQTLQNSPGQYGELSNIHVLEQTQQDNKPSGEVVSAVCVNVENGDYLAFANNQIITASDNSGFIRYTVHSLKGIKTS